MTWSKKQNTRAYEPIAAVSVTPNAGNITGLVVNEAIYTVDNDYICHFNLSVSFTQNAAAANDYTITLPLRHFTSAGPTGSGMIFNAGIGIVPVWSEAISATTLKAYILTGANAAAGTANQLKLVGQYPVR